MDKKFGGVTHSLFLAAAIAFTAQAASPVLAEGEGGQGSARYDVYLEKEPEMLARLTESNRIKALAKAERLESEQMATSGEIFSDGPEYDVSETAELGGASSKPLYDEVWQFGANAVQHNRGR